MDNPEKNWHHRAHKMKINKTKTQHHMQANTNNVNKTRALLQTTGGRDEQNIVEIIYQSYTPPLWYLFFFRITLFKTSHY
jgi:hypothetical protein